MKRWSCNAESYVEFAAIDAFLLDIMEVCVRHKLSLSHEDGHGAFEITDLDVDDAAWLRAAHDKRGEPNDAIVVAR